LVQALRDADREYSRYQGRDLDWAWRFRVQKAHVLVLQGAYGEALALLEEEPPASLGNSDVSVRRKMVQGIALDYSQKYDQAGRSLREAEQIAAASQPALLPDVYQARGNLELSEKKYPEASASYHQVLLLSGRQNRPFLEAIALGSLGYLAMWQEHYDEAIDWFKRAVEKSQQAGAQYALAKTFGNLGWNHAVVGDFDNAEASFKRAIDASAKVGLVADRVYWMNALGDVYYQQRRYREAKTISDEALQLAQGMENQRTLTECLNTLAEIELATGQLDLAEKHNEQAAAIENAGLDHFGVQYSRLIAARIALGKRQYAQAEAILRKILADPSVETSLKWQAQSRLAQVLAAENQPAKAEREFRLAISTIREAQDSLHRDEFRVSFLAGAIQFYDAYIDFLVARGRAVDALSIADLSRARALEQGLAEPSRTGRFASGAAPQKLAARFRSTLLFYSLGEQHSYLWVVTSAKVTLVALPPEKEISPLVASYKESILGSPDDPLTSQDSAGARLYSLLVGPAAKMIPRDSRVIILSDGVLDTFNFETLVVPTPRPHYWIDDVVLTNANSLALLARSRSMPPPRSPNLFLVGNPLSADASFPPLPQASTEISDVESYFPQKSRFLLTGAAATPDAYLKSDPARYAYLHFVTHGIASRLQPLESAVILSPSGDSYKLYAREIITRPLRAYLVTISACNGAGNRAYAGEGLVGLSWAFLRAGAHNVISALWEVSDASTPQLMNSLYEGLHRGEDPATALRRAKLSLLHSNTIYAKPFYWAPFQLYSGS
jgi:CHAT domain-containing protein